MTDFEKILEYQDMNIELRKMDREFEKLDDKKKLDVVRNKYNDLQDKVSTGAVEAQTLIDEINAAYEEHKNLLKSFDQISAAIEAAETDEEKIKFLPQLESVKTKLENIDRKITQKISRSRELVTDCAHAQDKKKSVKNTYDEIKKRLDTYRQEKFPERKAIEDKMEQLGPEIDKALFEKYNKIKSEGILPVVVKAIDDGKENYSCYCGISLSQAKKGELGDKKLCQCEHCRRMIYIS